MNKPKKYESYKDYKISSETLLDDGYTMIKKIKTEWPHNGDHQTELCFYKAKKGNYNYVLRLRLHDYHLEMLKDYFKLEIDKGLLDD